MASGRQGAEQPQIQGQHHQPIGSGSTEQRRQGVHRGDAAGWGWLRAAAVLELGLAQEDQPPGPGLAAALSRQGRQHGRIGSSHRQQQGSAPELLPGPGQGSEQGITQLQGGEILSGGAAGRGLQGGGLLDQLRLGLAAIELHAVHG